VIRRLSSSGLRRDCSRPYSSRIDAMAGASLSPKFSAANSRVQSSMAETGSADGFQA
jgi:hypothetical protein